MFPISFSIPIFHNSIPLLKTSESRINTGFWDKGNFHVLQDTSHQQGDLLVQRFAPVKVRAVKNFFNFL